MSQKEITTEILFQKLGKTWYTFSQIDSEVIYTALPDNVDPKSTTLEFYQVIEEHERKVKETLKIKNLRKTA